MTSETSVDGVSSSEIELLPISNLRKFHFSDQNPRGTSDGFRGRAGIESLTLTVAVAVIQSQVTCTMTCLYANRQCLVVIRHYCQLLGQA